MRRRRLLAGLASLGAVGAVVGGRVLARPDAPGGPEELGPGPFSPSQAVIPRGPGHHAGMNLAHLHRGDVGYGSAACRVQLARLRDMGVTHVALTPFGYVGRLDSTDIRFGASLDRTLSDAVLVKTAQDAAALGLKVCLKPHIWSRSFWTGGKSRQDISPEGGNWALWFERYTAFAVHYARVAREMNASLYVIGLEYLLATEGNPGAWADVATKVRVEFAGPLTYAANWWKEYEVFADWSSFDYIGVNAYFPLSKAADPDAAALVKAWGPHLDAMGAVAERVGKPVLFAEAGLRSVRGAAERPWDQGLPGETDPALQARAVEALLAAAGARPWFRGVYWWKWFTDQRAAEDDAYDLAGGPAEAVLARWWG
jgi:hypothetical protein